MKKKKIYLIADKLVNAFLKNKIISPIPTKFTKNINEANKLRKICENKINNPIIGFKAGGTAIPVLKKLKEKEPFYASVFKKNILKNNRSVKINKYTLGIELEVCFIVKKEILNSKKSLNSRNIKNFITHAAPCIEIVGYRQTKKGIKYLGDLCSDFGGNVKFIVGPKKTYKNSNFKNKMTKIQNKKINQTANGNTNTVYINPLNSLKFVINKLRKDKIVIKNNFYVFTGSTVGVVPILSKGTYVGKIQQLGSVKSKII